MNKLVAVLRIVMANPINRMDRLAALLRFFRWQVGSWLVPGKVLVPWIGGSRIFAGFMMSGSAGCAYSGLHEFEEMSFVLHFLRKGDLFMDVGANVGVFTVLAGKVVGAECISVEPGAEAFSHLLDNIVINGMEERIEAVNACISDGDGFCRFANAAESTLSHIAASPGETDTHAVATWKIDSLLNGRIPAMLKIDVEGFEKAALAGASETLGNPLLRAVLLEIGTHSLRYGVEPSEIHAVMLSHGFAPFSYDAFERKLALLDSYSRTDNTLYLRDPGFAEDRVSSADAFVVFGHKI